jgi:hypothetical protein
MPSRSRINLFVSLLTLAAAVAGVATPPAEGAGLWVDRPVDNLGDLSRLRITGNSAFTADVIRERLATDPDVMSTGHPTGYLKDYIATLERRIADGYRHGGFHEVHVAVDFAEQAKRIDVVVREGKRYRFGDVIIRGNDRVPTAELIAWLTTPKPDFTSTEKEYTYDPDAAPGAEPRWVSRRKNTAALFHSATWEPANLNKPMWKVGELGKFGVDKTATLERLVRASYAQHGFVNPKLKLSTVARDSTVDLIVDVEREAPQSMLAGFHIVGLERGDKAELLKLISVKTGDSFDRALITRVERALWQSGRFQNYALTFLPNTQPVTPVESIATNSNDAGRYPTLSKSKPAVGDEVSPRTTKVYNNWVQFGMLQITVKESLAAPPLGKPLTAEQQAMLKFRAWLLASAARGDEFTFRISCVNEWALEAIVSPTQGFVAEWKHRSSQNAGSWRSFGLVSTADTAALYVFDRGKKLEMKPVGVTVLAAAQVLQGDDEEQKTRFILGWGGRWLQEGNDHPTLQLTARITPAAAVAMATPDDDIECRVVDGVLVYDDVVRTRIDAATGKLLGVSYRSEYLPDSFIPNLFAQVRAEVKVGPGQLAARMKSWRERTSVLRNELDAAEPIASTLNFVLDEPAWNDLDDGEDALFPDMKSLVGLARKARDAKLAAPLVEAIVAFNESKQNDAEFLGDSSDLFARMADASFPRESWPWLQTREFGLAAMQRSRHTQQALERGAAEAGWGPLAFGCAAAGAKKFEYFYLAEPWSEQGMKRIEAADFQRDCRPLVDPKYLSGRLLQSVARFVRSLDEPEAEYLIKWTDGSAAWATACVKHLRAEPKQPLDEALPTALRKAWNKEAQVRLAGLMSMWLK